EETMVRCLFCSLALLLPAMATAGPQTGYPRPGLLIEPAELAKPEIADKYRILDTRSLDKFNKGHVYRASRVEVKKWAKDFAAGKEQQAWERELGLHGLELTNPVVVYGDDMRETARVCWILRYWGLRDVRILNGSLESYKAAGGKMGPTA